MVNAWLLGLTFFLSHSLLLTELMILLSSPWQKQLGFRFVFFLPSDLTRRTSLLYTVSDVVSDANVKLFFLDLVCFVWFSGFFYM